MLKAPASGLSPRFLALFPDGSLADRRLLDVGCGAGRVALALAPACRWTVGLDREPTLIEEARERAARAGLVNIEFHVADVEEDEYHTWRPDVVTAHLCASDAIVERAARALPPGGFLAMVAYPADQWRETGKVSRFAYDEGHLRASLRRAGLEVEALDVDAEVQRFGSVEEALAAAVGLEELWRADGRWFRYIEFLEKGGRTLTRSHLVAKARRP